MAGKLNQLQDELLDFESKVNIGSWLFIKIVPKVLNQLFLIRCRNNFGAGLIEF